MNETDQQAIIEALDATWTPSRRDYDDDERLTIAALLSISSSLNSIATTLALTALSQPPEHEVRS